MSAAQAARRSASANVAHVQQADAGASEKAAREALRSALAKRDMMQGEVEAAMTAEQQARRRIREAEDRVEAIERERAKPVLSRANDAKLVEVLLGDAPLVESESGDADRALRKLESEIAALKEAHGRMGGVIADRRERVAFAQSAVTDAVRVLISACPRSSACRRALRKWRPKLSDAGWR